MGQETASRLNLWIAAALTLGVLTTVAVSCLVTAETTERSRGAEPAGGRQPARPGRVEPGPRLTVVLPAQTGGYVRVQQRDEQRQLDLLRGAGLRNAVTGRYA